MEKRTVLAADNSQISTFLECPQKWYLEFRRNLTLPTRVTTGLDRGTIVHSLLDVYYKYIGLKAKPQEAGKLALELFEKNKDGKVSPEDYKLIRERFVQYVLCYSVNDYRPLISNGNPQVEIGFSIRLLDTEYYLFVLEGRIDLITENGLFVDHKSQSKATNHYRFDTQFMTYAFATGLRNGVINYFGLQEKFNPNTFRRVPLAFGHEHLERWRARLLQIFWQMSQCIASRKYPPNESACAGKYGSPCQFTEIHETLNKDLRKSIIANHYVVKERWQPWKLEEANAT